MNLDERARQIVSQITYEEGIVALERLIADALRAERADCAERAVKFLRGPLEMSADDDDITELHLRDAITKED